MKNIINTLIFVFLFIALINYAKKQQMSEKKNEPNYEEKIEYVPDEKSEPIEKKNFIYLKGLGDTDDGDLEFAYNVINEFANYEIIIDENVAVSTEIINKETIDAQKFINKFNDTVLTIYLTEYSIFEQELKLRGYTTIYGKSIIIESNKDFMSETIKHEIGHTLGLKHCQDKTCTMAINNDEWDKGEFCQECKNKINTNILR